MIPKIIHYCWFGRQPKPEIVLTCIESWKKYCPEWKIIEWNESNFDVAKHPYMKEAYERKKWAFVSDVARLLIVYNYGGVYLDTDVKLSTSFDEKIVDIDAFFVFESNRYISTGLGFGAKKHHQAVKQMIKYYDSKHFIGKKGKEVLVPCPRGNTESFKELYKDFARNGQTQRISDALILSYPEYSAIAKHYGTATWVEGGKSSNRIYHDTILKKVLRDPKRFEFIEKYLGKRVTDYYTFLVYDFLELGMGYYLKRIISRFIKGK